MQKQLQRIKNKDLKSLDERLFGNLDKVETINSTIQNLGQFQQFLLKQISQFEEKAKTKNKSKEVTQVIELNCLTLRESIMNVVPDDLEGSRSRMRQTVTSPINGFRSTRVGFKKDIPQQQSFRVHQCKETELIRKIEQLEFNKQNNIKIQEALNLQLAKAKSQEIKALRQIESLKQQNERLKDQNQHLKDQNTQLSYQLKNTISSKQKHKSNEQLFQNPLQVSTQLTRQPAMHSSLMRKSQFKQELNQHNPMSFKDKMKLDFTSKLNKYQNSQLKTKKNITQSQHPQDSDTFRQSATTDLTPFQSIYQAQNCQFRSIEVNNHYDSDLDPNVPKLLKRNSISGHHQKILQQTLLFKPRIPLSSYDSNINVRSNYQSAQKTVQVKHETNTSKKVNHDLMRKTKSNFFKHPVQNKENSNLIIDTFYETNIAKMKGLVNQSNPNDRKRNSQSKQKLKIFSMM